MKNKTTLITRIREFLELYPNIISLYIINSEGECIIVLTNELDERIDYSASIKIIFDLAYGIQSGFDEIPNILMARFKENLLVLAEESSYYVCIKLTNKNFNLKNIPRIKTLFKKVIKTLGEPINE